MITLELDHTYRDVVSAVERLPKRMDLAQQRALKKLGTWLQRQALRAISAQTGMPQKTFKDFKRVRLRISGTEGELWLGLNPLPLHAFGRISWSQGSSGVRVRGKTYEGTFFRAVYGSTPKVWIRRSRNETAGHQPYLRARRKHPLLKDYTKDQVSAGRFPVMVVAGGLEDSEQVLSERLPEMARERFLVLLQQEINYQLYKET